MKNEREIEMTTEIEFDFSCEAGQAMLDFIYKVEDLGGRVANFKAYGPGGGNPCIVFAFTDNDSLRQAALEYFEYDEAEADEYISEYAV
jgi:hypothetical protein